MSDAVVSMPAFASELLEHVLVGERPLPPGFAGLSPTEIDCFNYYQAHRIPDRTLMRSQLHQDLWVAFLLDCGNPHSPFHRGGFFVEFGALDGMTLSNTYLFEKQFGWRGILVEPAPELFAQCSKRRACITDSRCVWRTSGETVAFNQVPGNAELATIDECGGRDFHAAARESSRQIISVPTVSLTDLLAGWNAPEVVDYLSIDTEGSEYEILKAFDFSRHAFRTLTVEHNFTPQREHIRELLAAHGYERVPRPSSDSMTCTRDWIYCHCERHERRQVSASQQDISRARQIGRSNRRSAGVRSPGIEAPDHHVKTRPRMESK